MDQVLLSSEIEFFVDTMKPTELEAIGSNQWLEWHQRLQKLNQQALIEAATMQEEHVKETIVSFQKAPVLIHEAIIINLWKYKILPEILRLVPNPPNTFLAYTILYHEAVSVALLELIAYHESCTESLEDSAFDLLDYLYSTLVQFLNVKHVEEVDANESSITELLRQRDNLTFEIGIRCLSIMRYLSQYLDTLPLGISSWMFEQNDVPMLLTEILLQRPWFKDGKLYTKGKWIESEDEAVGQPEAQVWLALHQLLLHPSCMATYQLTNQRRGQLAKLQPLIHPVLMDQLSVLCELKQWLCMATVSDCPQSEGIASKPLLLIPVLGIKEALHGQGDGRWEQLAEMQAPVVFCGDQKKLVDMAQKLCEAYNTDLIEKLEVKGEHECDQCGRKSIQRCSRCKKGWYCSRKCQVTHWPQHQEMCNQLQNE